MASPACVCVWVRPQGFDFESPRVPRIRDGSGRGNLQARAQMLLRALLDRSGAYRTSHVMVPFGDDFKFMNAEVQFENMDKLIRAINDDPDNGVTIRYSTPSEYFTAARQEATAKRVAFPVFEHADFYPYADNRDSYWTGYYTTRPHLKARIRNLAAALRSAEVLHVFARAMGGAPHDEAWAQQQFQRLESGRLTLAGMMHHDAVTGTSRKHVVVDYMQQLDVADDHAAAVSADAVQRLVGGPDGSPGDFTARPHVLRVEDLASLPPGHATPVLVTNSLAWARSQVVRLPLIVPDGTEWSHRVCVATSQAAGPGGVPTLVPSQLHVTLGGHPDHRGDVQVQSGSTVAADSFGAELAFLAHDVPGLGFQTYFVFVEALDGPSTMCGTQPASAATTATVHVVKGGTVKRQRGRRAASSSTLRGTPTSSRSSGRGPSRFVLTDTPDDQPSAPGTVTLRNGCVAASFDTLTGLLHDITSRSTGGHNVLLRQQFAHYHTRRSGAYLFRPTEAPEPVAPDAKQHVVVSVVRGPVMSMVQVHAGPAYTQVRGATSRAAWVAVQGDDVVVARACCRPSGCFTRHLIAMPVLPVLRHAFTATSWVWWRCSPRLVAQPTCHQTVRQS